MSEAVEGAAPSGAVWQPFTFGGQAAMAHGRLGRLFLAQLAVALLVGASVVGFLQRAYCPVILQAVREMPETARIADGRLTGVDSTLIAERKLLAIAITPEPAAPIGQSADVQVQLRPTNFRVGSVFVPDWGWEFDYGPGVSLDLSRSKLEPWWGAWRPIVLTVAGVTVLVLLLLVWAVLALFYAMPAGLLAWFADRRLPAGAAWRLGLAALLPGALLMAAAIFLYGVQAVDLVGLGFLFVAHLLIGWVYLTGGALACPRLKPIPPKPNPFIS